MENQLILITGSSGFIGGALVNYLSILDYKLIACSRSLEKKKYNEKVTSVTIRDSSDELTWENTLKDVDVVIHTAGQSEVLKGDTYDYNSTLYQSNVVETLNLAKRAVNCGVKRFIYISSAKVNGEVSEEGQALTERVTKNPTDDYARSKYEAEKLLLDYVKDLAMDVVIVRPVMVYGPKVKSNFLTLIKLIYKGVPLPFGAVYNKRSFIGLYNLLDLLSVCINHTNAGRKIFLASDNDDFSTTELLIMLKKHLKSSTLLFAISDKLLLLSLKFLGKEKMANSLLSSLQFDISYTMETLGWKPPYSVSYCIEKTVEDFLIDK